MTIDELNALTTLTATDEVPVWDSEESGEPTKKITASNLAASVKSLGSLIGTGDLDSTPTQGSNKAVTSGGTYTAIQQSTARFGTASICINTTNSDTFTFTDLHDLTNSNIFKHGLIVWGVGEATINNGLSVLFINTNGTVAIQNVAGSARTFTGSIANGALTIRANTVVYGGLKLIWLN